MGEFSLIKAIAFALILIMVYAIQSMIKIAQNHHVIAEYLNLNI